MAVTDVDTSKLLNRWAEIMEENTYLFNQITGVGVPMPQGCEQMSIYIQRDRDMIADSLHDAVQASAERLGFYPRPTYVHERLPLGLGIPLERQTLRTRWKYLQAFGRRTTSLIDDDVAVVYSDANGDNVLDTATITLTLTTDVDVSQIKVFFRSNDGAPDDANDLWEIEPLRVVKTGLNVTISGHRGLFVKPDVVWDVPYDPPSFLNKFSGDVGVAGNFVTLVDVYRVYTDSSAALVFNADPLLNCSTTGLDSNVTYDGVGRIVDAEIGSFMGRYSDACPPYYAETVDVYYLAGLPLVNGMMERRLEKALIRYSNTMMGQTPTSFCERQLNMWQWDTALYKPADLPAWLANNPLGLARGAVEMWKVIAPIALPGGGVLP